MKTFKKIWFFFMVIVFLYSLLEVVIVHNLTGEQPSNLKILGIILLGIGIENNKRQN